MFLSRLDPNVQDDAANRIAAAPLPVASEQQSSDTMHNPEYTDLFGESMEFSPDVDPVLLNWDPNHTPVSVKRELSESPIRRRHR